MKDGNLWALDVFKVLFVSHANLYVKKLHRIVVDFRNLDLCLQIKLKGKGDLERFWNVDVIIT